jgi:hypothetical protein
LTESQLLQTLTEAYPIALRRAALEAFGGVYEAKQLAQMVERTTVEQEAMMLIETYCEEDAKADYRP